MVADSINANRCFLTLVRPMAPEVSESIVNAIGFEPNVRMETALQNPIKPRRGQVLPATKRRYPYDNSLACRITSLQDMFEAPKPKRRKKGDDEGSDESSSGDIFQSKEGEKRGTTQYHLARALDSMLLNAGVGGLATWREENPPCRMLSPTEFRYELTDLEPFERHQADVWQRWCVQDAATGRRRYEVPATTDTKGRPLLVTFADECTSQVSLVQVLAYGADVRLWFFCDPFHRIWNDVKLALQEAGLWADVFERLHCENLPTGAFETPQWGREMQAVMKNHFRANTKRNPLFEKLYPGLEAEARALGALSSPSDSDEVSDEVWKWLRDVSKLTRQKGLTKTKTWFEPLVAMAQGLKVHNAYLYVLCILCKDQGHFKTIADMPIHGGALEPALVKELPGEAILSRKRQGGQHTFQLHALKLRCANNCVAACHLQGYADAKPRADIICTVGGPVWRAYGYDYKYLNEPKQVKLKYTKAKGLIINQNVIR